jgi:hypothetical protein
MSEYQAYIVARKYTVDIDLWYVGTRAEGMAARGVTTSTSTAPHVMTWWWAAPDDDLKWTWLMCLVLE